MSYMNPSLASATSTRVDSSSKHIIPCRVSTDHLLMWCENDVNELTANKSKYAMHKDEIVLSVGRDLFLGYSRINTRRKAYPPVVTTLAKIPESTLTFIRYLYHQARTWTERDQIIENCLRRNGAHVGDIICLPDFTFMGISLGHAYAHPMSGDTVASSMIGGLRTVLNGGFNMNAGDLVQWYFDFEEDLFHKAPHGKEGARLSKLRGEASSANGGFHDFLAGIKTQLDGLGTQSRSLRVDDGNVNVRRDFHMRQHGADSHTRKQNMARIKTFKFDEDSDVSVYDKCRVFGRAISSARPFEMVDIMISRQSI